PREFYDKFVQERGQEPGARADLGKALFRLAQITGEIDSQRQAIELHRQAARIFTDLAAESPNVHEYRSDLALAQHHLGRLYRLTGQLGKAETFCRQAIAGWQQLVRDHPKEARYRAARARSRNVLGNVYQVTRNL